MKVVIRNPRGEVPRVASHLLPDNASAEAVNCRLLTGDLTAWKQFADVQDTLRAGPVRSLFLLDDLWLSSDDDLDYARGAIAGDTDFTTFITGMDVPRFTTRALASSGPEPYPFATRPLGVPGPDSVPTLQLGIDSTPTTFSVDTLDLGDELATSWSVNPLASGGGTFAEVTQSVGPDPVPSYKATYDENGGRPAYGYRNFGVSGVTVLNASVDFYLGGDSDILQACMIVGATALGAGVSVVYDGATLSVRKTTLWGARSFTAVLSTIAVSNLAQSVWHTLTAAVITNPDGTKTVTAGVYTGSAQIGTLTATNTFEDGDYCGFANDATNDAATRYITFYRNYLVQASGSAGYVPANLATSYVFTFVNDLGQESAPSLPSATVVRPDGVSVTVTTPVAVPSGVGTSYGITTKRIYRAATGNTGTVYRFAAEIPLATADYVDVLTDAQLGEVLESDDWDLPPDDLRGILALPNGVMVGFSKNQLCLSAQNHPHAWPIIYRLTVDTNIVGLGNVDTTVVIGTESFVYVASGSDPAAYSMNKFEVPQAASSKNSFAYLAGIGVTFAGPDGLMAVAGVGQVRNLTDVVFTREQWQALNPPSMHAVSHNDVYWLFWESGSNRGCYAIDMKPTGFGVVTMAFHASAAYVDPIRDAMFMVLDWGNEPDDPSLPVHPSAQPTVNGHYIAEFEGNPSVLLTYAYTSKLWLTRPVWMAMAQLHAADYDNILFRLYGDGVQVDEAVIPDETEFTTLAVDEYTEVQLQVLGTSTVREVTAVEDVSELDGGR